MMKKQVNLTEKEQELKTRFIKELDNIRNNLQDNIIDLMEEINIYTKTAPRKDIFIKEMLQYVTTLKKLLETQMDQLLQDTNNNTNNIKKHIRYMNNQNKYKSRD